MGTTLRQTNGPWAGRYLAALQHWNGYGPSHWDCAARLSDIPAPRLLLPMRVHEKTSETLPQEHAPPDTKPPLLDRPPRRSRDELHARNIETPEPVAPKPSPPQPTISVSRDLKEFEVLGNSPSRKRAAPWKGDGAPSRLEPRAWGGRNLATLSQNNFIRGGYSPPPERAPRGKSENSTGSSKGNIYGKYKSAPTSLPYGKSKSERLQIENK